MYVGESEIIQNIFVLKDTILFNPVEQIHFSTLSHLFSMHVIQLASGTSKHIEQYSQHNKIQKKPFWLFSGSPTYVFQRRLPLKGLK